MKAHRNEPKKEIRVAIAGLGNCASALIQIIFYISLVGNLKGLMHNILGGYGIPSIKIVYVLEASMRKVGRDVSDALFAQPNCTEKIFKVPFTGVRVSRGPTLDGVAFHMRKEFCPGRKNYMSKRAWKKKIVRELKRAKVDVFVNYMPVGSDQATAFYADCAIKAHCAFVNCMPSFIVSTAEWIEKFTTAGLPCIGDDIKSQLGATILHRAVLRLLEIRGCKIEDTSQENYGNDSDFRNMQDSRRMKTKHISKTQGATSSVAQKDFTFRLRCDGIDESREPGHKVCYLTFRAITSGVQIGFQGILEVVDAYDSAGCVIDAIRIAKIALDRGIAGPILPACAFLMKSPPQQMDDEESVRLLEEWIADDSRTIIVSHSRSKDVISSGQNFSEVWTRICKDILNNAVTCGIKGVKVISPKEHYHDEEEFVRMVEAAIKELMSYPSYYHKNLVIPFGVKRQGLKKRLLAALLKCPEINIYAINVPPDEEFLSALPNISGYAGLDEVEVGRELYRELVSRHENLSKVLVIYHEKNRGLDLRIEGIEKSAGKDNVAVLNSYEHRRIKQFIAQKNVGVITLGCRGTEAILKCLKATNYNVPLVCMDSNDRIKSELSKMGVGTITSFIHEHLYGGIVLSGYINNVNMSPQKVTC